MTSKTPTESHVVVAGAMFMSGRVGYNPVTLRQRDWNSDWHTHSLINANHEVGSISLSRSAIGCMADRTHPGIVQ